MHNNNTCFHFLLDNYFGKFHSENLQLCVIFYTSASTLNILEENVHQEGKKLPRQQYHFP